MAKPFVRIVFASSGRDFPGQALDLGVPLVNRTGVNNK